MEIVKCCKTLAIFCKYKHIIIHVKNHFIFPPGHILPQNQTVCMVRHHSLEKKQNKKNQNILIKYFLAHFPVQRLELSGI